MIPHLTDGITLSDKNQDKSKGKINLPNLGLRILLTAEWPDRFLTAKEAAQSSALVINNDIKIWRGIRQPMQCIFVNGT